MSYALYPTLGILIKENERITYLYIIYLAERILFHILIHKVVVNKCLP